MNCRFIIYLHIISILLLSASCAKEESATQKISEQTPATVDAPSQTGTGAVEGTEIFAKNCQICHGEGGKGDICPNLTDRELKYGNSDEQLFETIFRGRPGGMPEWKNRLSEKQIRDVIAYIRSIREQ